MWYCIYLVRFLFDISILTPQNLYHIFINSTVSSVFIISNLVVNNTQKIIFKYHLQPRKSFQMLMDINKSHYNYTHLAVMLARSNDNYLFAGIRDVSGLFLFTPHPQALFLSVVGKIGNGPVTHLSILRINILREYSQIFFIPKRIFSKKLND